MSIEASPLLQRLLQVAFRQHIIVADLASGIARLTALGNGEISPDDWQTAVMEALAAGYIHDPVRLPAGALQCHWHLELTPTGVEAARWLMAAKRGKA